MLAALFRLRYQNFMEMQVFPLTIFPANGEWDRQRLVVGFWWKITISGLVIPLVCGNDIEEKLGTDE